MRLVFLVGVLGIQNQNVRALKEFDELSAIPERAFLGLLRTEQMRFRGVQLECFVRFVIRQISDRAFAGQNAIAHANARMIHESSAHANAADFEIHRIELLNLDLSRQVVKLDREKRRGHLSFENFLKSAPAAVITENLNLILVVVSGHKKREALNVVPMNVRDQQSEMDRIGAKLIFQCETELANSRSRIEHDQLAISADLNAARVSTVAHGGRTGDGNRAANSPDF